MRPTRSIADLRCALFSCLLLPALAGCVGGDNQRGTFETGGGDLAMAPPGSDLSMVTGSSHDLAGTPPSKDMSLPSQGGPAVTVYVEPNGNGGSELVSAINAAQSSVYMTMYQIDDPKVEDALVARKEAGLDVKVILDGSTTNKSGNTAAFDAFQTAKIGVVWSNPSFTYTHEKCVIIDGKSAWIMTMNANKSSPLYDREYLALDQTAADVAEATAIFQADYAMQSISPSGALVVANNNARPMLVTLIDTATKSLDIEVEEFSDTYSTGMVNAVAAAARRGVKVRIVIANETLVAAQMTANSTVKAAGASVVMTGPTSGAGTTNNPYIHAKAIAVDCALGACTSGFVGSENFTGGSLGYNRELGVIFNDATQLAKVESTIAGDFARGTPQ